MSLPTVRKFLKIGNKLLKRKSKPQGLVLLYHRIASVDNDPWDLCVTPENFEEHLGILQHLGVCRTLGDIPGALDKRNSFPVFSVTFDDGYSDNATAALPILTARKVPATAFVVSQSVGTDRAFWWDVLDRIFLQPGTLPSILRLEAGGRACHWELGSARRYSVAEFRRDAAWRAERGTAGNRRQQVFLELWHVLVGLASKERERLVRLLLEWAQLDPGARQSSFPVSEGQLAALAGSELIEVGAHTRTHPSLPSLLPIAQDEEIAGSKKDIESLIGRPVVSFSYPHGRFTDTTVATVRKAGFQAACTSEARALSRDCAPLTLPRVQVKNWKPQAFRRVVTSYL